MPTDYAVVPEDKAKDIKTGIQSLWFTRLMDGSMLDMKKRPQLTKAQQMASQGLRLRTKQHAPTKDGLAFYVWFDGSQQPALTEAEMEDVLAEIRAEADDDEPPI